MSFPIPIQTTDGVVHLYCKYKIPIIGTRMTKPRHVVIIVTETKRYCGFLSENIHEIKNYVKVPGKELIFAEYGIRKLEEEKLIKCPSESMGPFKLIESIDSMIPNISINFVSYPKIGANPSLAGSGYDEHLTNEFRVYNGDGLPIVPIPIADLIVNFQLRAFQFDDHKQGIDVITSSTFDNDPKLEVMLKKLWRIEQGFEKLPLKQSDDKPSEYL